MSKLYKLNTINRLEKDTSYFRIRIELIFAEFMAIDDRIKKIEDEIQKTPYNKATSHHIGNLKQVVLTKGGISSKEQFRG